MQNIIERIAHYADIRCSLNHSGTMPNFARSNAYSVFPFTTFTFVSRPSAIIAFTSPVQLGGGVLFIV